MYGRAREDVRRQLTKLLEQADQGIPVAAESWTLAKYLAYWLEHVVKPERKPRTYQGYEGVVRLYLIPELCNKRLAKLSRVCVGTWPPHAGGHCPQEPRAQPENSNPRARSNTERPTNWLPAPGL